MTALWVTLIGVALTSIAGLAGAVWTANSSRRAAKETAQSAPYAALSERVTNLEKQVVALLRQIRNMEDREFIIVRWIKNFVCWVKGGMQGASPSIPKNVQDVLDPNELVLDVQPEDPV